MPDIFGGDFDNDKPSAKPAKKAATKRADIFGEDFAADLAPPKPASPIGDSLAAGWQQFKERAPGTITGQIVKAIGQGMALPGQAAQGAFQTAPSVPGQWSDEDEARAQINQQNLVDRSANLGGLVMGGPAPSVVRQGASAIPFLNYARGTSPATAEIARTAIEKYGIPVRPGQMSDNHMVRSLDTLLQKLPFSGYRGNMDAQREGFNRAVTGLIGENADALTPEVMSQARTRLGRTYNDLFRSERAAPDEQFARGVGGILDQARQVIDSPHKFENLSRAVSNILDKMGPDGTIPGRAYQGLRNEKSTLKKMAQNGGDLGLFAREVRNELDGLFRRSVSPENRQVLADTDRQYAIMKSLRPLVDEGGDISPARLMGIARKGDAGLERVAFGNGGDMAELANIGQRFKPVGSSNTAENSWLLNLMQNPLAYGIGGMGAGAAGLASGSLPLTLAGLGAGAGLTRGLGQFMKSPTRASNIIDETLMRGGAGQGDELGYRELMAILAPRAEMARRQDDVTVRPWAGPTPP